MGERLREERGMSAPDPAARWWHSLWRRWYVWREAREVRKWLRTSDGRLFTRREAADDR